MKLRGASIFLLSLYLLNSCSYFPEDFDRGVIEEMSETRKYIQLGREGESALIFYPGGLVDPFAYVNFLSQLASDEVTVFIAKVPYNLSILDIDHAKGIRKAFPKIQEWSIMGHSLGGAVACFEVRNNPDAYSNLILLASYPSSGTDLKDFSGLTLSLFGSNDDVLDRDLLERSKEQFFNVQELDDLNNVNFSDRGSFFYEIEGGNHSQFANYGNQKGDGEASITRQEQQNIVTDLVKLIL